MPHSQDEASQNAVKQTQPICVGWLEKQNCHGWKCEHGSGERWDEIETRIMASFVAHHPRLWQNGTSCRDALAPSNSMQSPRALRKYTKVPSSSHCVPLAWLLLLICSFASASAAAGTNGGAPGGWKCHKQNLNAALVGFYMLITPGEYSPNDSPQSPAKAKTLRCSKKGSFWPFGCNNFETTASETTLIRHIHRLSKTIPAKGSPSWKSTLFTKKLQPYATMSTQNAFEESSWHWREGMCNRNECSPNGLSAPSTYLGSRRPQSLSETPRHRLRLSETHNNDT